jgi:O-antigen ligase
MFQHSDESAIAKILSFGAATTTLLVVTGSVTDPVNSTKLFALGIVACALFFTIAMRVGEKKLDTGKFLPVVLLVFILTSLAATVVSKSPLKQNIYGTYGRNTGFFTYLFLCILFLAGSFLSREKSFRLISRGLLITGLLNVIYGAWVLAFGDPINWNNPYGALLGTFGNPNFISSFLGIFGGGLFALLLLENQKLWKRLSESALLVVTFYQISETNSIQGYVVFSACIGYVLLARILGSRFKKFALPYLVMLVAAGALAILGALKIGPLSTFLYQGTLAFREQYWRAGINMGLSNPFTGVGMDAYGDNYRLFRELTALTTPGVQVVTNSAHNVFIDIFASGGFILLSCYLILTITAAISLFKVLARKDKYNLSFTVISSSWFGYQLQSLISINQIGLAIWGWLLGGALIGYERMTRVEFVAQNIQGKKARKKSEGESIFSANLLAGIGAVVGAVIAVPPLSADISFANSTKTGNYEIVKSALNPTYLHPESSARLVNMVQILENGKLYQQAREFALIAVKYNPNNFDSWFALHSINLSTTEDKALALKNMKRLDPRNPDVTSR